MTDTLSPAASRVTITQALSNRQGPLPLIGNTFHSEGGTLILTASGSGSSGAPGAVIGMNVLVDGAVVATGKAYANQAAVHMAFVPVSVALPAVGRGSHVIRVQPLDGTVTDFNDVFNVTVAEFHTV